MLTGAGISTASGIGDYRDAEGEWKRAAPIMHQAFVSEHTVRQRYWARSQRGYPGFREAEPNIAHRELVRWERTGLVHGLITQNVDGLHQRAGHQRVIDLHGRLSEVICLDCGRMDDRDKWQSWLEGVNPDVRDDFYAPAPDGDSGSRAERFQ